MKTRFQVLSKLEIERIHAASLEILEQIGIKVSYKTAREIYKQAGADLDENTFAVKISEQLVRWALGQAPKKF